MSILQTIDLKKYYGTEPNITRALDGVNFSVEDGEFVAVVGTSGSGKSNIAYSFMEEAICYCNNAKLTIESFSYLGQFHNYITLLIQPVRKFFRAGCSCFYSLFSL